MELDVSQHTPACITCMYIYANHTVGDFYCNIVVLRFARTPPLLCHSWKQFYSFCSGNGGGITRELLENAILPAASLSQRSTKHKSDWQGRRPYGVCCWLRMQPTINTTLSPKAYRCLKQAHRRRIEDILLSRLVRFFSEVQPGAMKLVLWRHWCMKLRCIEWPQRTNFTAPGCTRVIKCLDVNVCLVGRGVAAPLRLCFYVSASLAQCNSQELGL